MSDSEEIRNLDPDRIETVEENPDEQNIIEPEEVEHNEQLSHNELENIQREMNARITNIENMFSNMTSTLQSLVSKRDIENENINAVLIRESASKKTPTRPTSGASTRPPSRPASPTTMQGVTPILYDAVNAAKILLQNKTEKYPEMLQDIRSHVTNPMDIQNRVKAERSAIEQTTKDDISQHIAHILNLEAPTTFEEIIIRTVPESDRNETLGANSRKEFVKGFSSRIKGNSPNLRYAIETIKDRYDNQLSHTQIKHLLTDISDGTFKDVVNHTFRNNDTKNAIAYMLTMYGDLRNPVEVSTEFYNLRLDMRNLDESMKTISQKAQQCLPNATIQEVNQKAMSKILEHLPKHSMYAISEKLEQHNRTRQFNPRMPHMSFPSFMKLVKDNTQSHNDYPRRQIRPIHEIHTQEETEGACAIIPPAENSEMQNFKHELIETMKAMSNQPYRQRTGPSPITKIGNEHPEHGEAMKTFQNDRTVEQNMKDAMNGARFYRKKDFMLKTEFDRNDLPHFKKNDRGEIIHESEPFKEPVFVKLKSGRYALSDAIMRRVSEICYRCFYRKCSPLNPKCPFYDEAKTDSFELCSNCKRGFHIARQCVFAKN